MPRRLDRDFPSTAEEGIIISGHNFHNENIDRRIYTRVIFEYCLFSNIGMKDAEFSFCVFKHCEFSDCYLVYTKFRNCDFSWCEFIDTKLDYTKYWRCAPVLAQVTNAKPSDPQSASKFFRNLAIEHKNLGNWDEVDRFIAESYRERERHYKYAFCGENDHYRRRYGGFKRWRYFGRYLSLRLSRIVWGYGVSWGILLRSALLLWALILPVANLEFGKITNLKTPSLGIDPIDNILQYVGILYKSTTQAFMPFIPVNVVDAPENFILPYWLVFTESAMGLIFLALFASMIFRTITKGM